MRPFDLATGPLVRARLLRLADEDHVLLLTMHHIISDAWSAGIFLQELGVLYEAFCAGNPSPLPELTVQYADYAAQERQWLQGEVLEKQLAFWREQLQGVPPVLDLPLDRPRPETQDVSRRVRDAAHSPGELACAEGTRPPGRRHTLHDVDGGLSGVAVAVLRPGADRRGHRSWPIAPCPRPSG